MKIPTPLLQEKIFEALVKSGEQPYRAKMVSDFVSACYGLLHCAHRNLIQEENWRKFLNKAGARNPRRKKPASNTPPNIAETALSADLSLEANNILEEPQENDGYLTRGQLVSVIVPDATTPSSKSTGLSSKRPDIVFHPAAAETKLKFCVEAKIIRLVADIERELLGESGFGCFVRKDDPYTSNGVVGLIGYADQRDISTLASGVKEKMKGSPLFNAVESQMCSVAYGSTNSPNEFVVGEIKNSTPKVCVANVLGFELTTQPTTPLS